MPPDVIAFIIHYGYLAVFLIVFSQEVGIPNPIPNELVLMFTGYLTFKGILFLPLVILVAVSADFSGTSILYTVFYFSGVFIMKHKPKWFPVSESSISKLSARIVKGGIWRLYLCRVTPFLRGYTSIIAGLLKIKPRIFLPVAAISAATWAAIYVIAGRLLGPWWSYAGTKLGSMKYYILAAVVLVFLIVGLVRHFRDRAAQVSK